MLLPQEQHILQFKLEDEKTFVHFNGVLQIKYVLPRKPHQMSPLYRSIMYTTFNEKYCLFIVLSELLK